MKRSAAKVHLSQLKPGLNAAISAYKRSGTPISITSAAGEALAQFVPRQRYLGGLSGAFRVSADRFRKRRARLANAVYWGLTILVRQRDGREFVLYPPTEYRDEINPREVAKQTRERLFGTVASGSNEIAGLRKLIVQVSAKLDLLVETMPSSLRTKPASTGRGPRGGRHKALQD